jgi:hypothetical protein
MSLWLELALSPSGLSEVLNGESGDLTERLKWKQEIRPSDGFSKMISQEKALLIC